ncbi:ATP-binding protein [Schumannella luteola]|uniref:Uncharacterized protein YPO0396 n=1 Tax=Schumannella luteola TaxID=472059 RepID=A0A852YA61_9MICO|nr:SbcC/MukB-like Walker B domain-containing protein [Schumannella luteola]NYG98164.1 uncharacterized protein YPO0396 [Schumannella luteola]TPX01880.1 hypothetical protein FJ656_26210 [Schumannella luteola]
MTMLDTLFGLIPAASRGQQWVADDLQLVNWGGYDGAHRVRFSPVATLLCGGSGSGKSTLMDAYIALMMPHTTPFNGASNGAVVGRPRGAEQRNILSYGRGKLDESRTDDGTKIRVLRGDGSDTWTAVAMTWADHDGSKFTAVRAWYIPANARTVDDTVRVRASVASDFDLRTLESAAADRMSDASVRATGLDTLATDREFSARIHTVLGIGAAGAGSKAMSLLARIQAGQQITTVDELYKRMVLEEPETLAVADAAVTHFDELEGTRARMITAQQQVRALLPIREMRERIEEAGERLRLIDRVGVFDDADSLASLWRAERRRDLLREVEGELRDATRTAEAELREQEVLADAAEQEREALGDILRDAGGDRLDTANRELRALESRLTGVQRERTRFDEALAALEATVATERAFGALHVQARSEIAKPDAKQAARDARGAATAARMDADRALKELRRERELAARSDDNIPHALRESRRLVAEAAGLRADELPFVGELIEVRAEFEPWREAFNLALGGFATTLLIDAATLPAFRRAIDSVRTPQRLRFQGVHTGQAEGRDADPRTLPGRLDYRSTPFTGWLRGRLEDRFGFVCVDDSSELRDHSAALTITGQVSQGDRGEHGGHGRANVLGFSAERRIAELDAQITRAERTRVEAVEAERRADAELDTVDSRHAAYVTIAGLTWQQVDTAGIESEIARWTGIVDEVTAGDPRIGELREQIEAKRRRAGELREQIGRTRSQLEKLQQDWADTTDDVDATQATLDRAEREEIGFDAAQSAYLDERFLAPSRGAGAGTGAGTRADNGDDVDDATAAMTGGAASASSALAALAPSERLRRFDTALDSAGRRLDADQTAAQGVLVEQREALRRTLAGFLERWPNPNLLADPDQSFGDFERILDDLQTSGLHELETEWRDSLLTLSGNDLTNLDSTISRSLREIRERIEPINVIMADLPFYDDAHRLQITPRESQSTSRQRFRRELREVRAAIETVGAIGATPEDRDAVYARMTKLIARIRRTAPDFADLIDVRNHVRVSAERVTAVGKQHVALYDHIGEKSGGESQELIAFIVGAALRYQLGDAGADRPRYAPVFLDEALIKADAHFTKRAIGAWRGLGFQLIIGAPNDKYSAIEPHVEVEYDILKDTSGRSWAKPKVAVPDAAAGSAESHAGAGAAVAAD